MFLYCVFGVIFVECIGKIDVICVKMLGFWVGFKLVISLGVGWWWVGVFWRLLVKYLCVWYWFVMVYFGGEW